MNVYNLTDIKIMGERDEQGLPIKDEKFGYTYWCTAEGVDMNLRFSTHTLIATSSAVISAEESYVPPGKNYMQLKKVKTSGSPTTVPTQETKVASPPPAADQVESVPSPPVPGLEAELESINAKLDKILEYVQPLDKVVDVDTDEEVNLADIPF